MDVGKRLRQLMDERGLTIYALAKKADIPWNTIYNLSEGRSYPTVATLAFICDGLGITLAQFFDDGGETMSLTETQMHLIERWNVISDKERQIISDMLDVMLEKKVI